MSQEAENDVHLCLTSLIPACSIGNTTAVRAILQYASKEQKELQFDSRDNQNWTALHHAVWHRHVECVELLLEHHDPEIDVRAETYEGLSALHLACIKSEMPIRIVELLLNADRELVHYVDNELVSPLHKAVHNGRVDIVQRLIEAGANVNYRDLDGETALHMAARSCNSDIIDYLLYMTDCNAALENMAGLNALCILGVHPDQLIAPVADPKNLKYCIHALLRFTYKQIKPESENNFELDLYDFYDLLIPVFHSIMQQNKSITKIYMESLYRSAINSKAFFIDLLNKIVPDILQTSTFFIIQILMHDKINSLRDFRISKPNFFDLFGAYDIFPLSFFLQCKGIFDVILPEFLSKGIETENIFSVQNFFISESSINEYSTMFDIDKKYKDKMIREMFRLLSNYGINILDFVQSLVLQMLTKVFPNCNGFHYLKILLPLTTQFYLDVELENRNNLDISLSPYLKIIEQSFVQAVEQFGSNNYYNFLLQYNFSNVQINVPSLQHLCRLTIRDKIFDKQESDEINLRKFENFVCPVQLKKYILFDYLD